MMSQGLVQVTEEEVMFFDTDVGGVVHNIAYLRMIETCRTRLAAQLGFDLKAMMESQQFPVVARTEIDYRRPAKLGDILVIKGWVSEMKRTSFWCEFEVRVKESEVCLITCRQKLELVQIPEARPLRLPKELFS